MKKLKFKNYPYIIKNTGYSTLQITLIYPVDYKKENIISWHLIRQIVLNTSSLYKSEEEFRQARDESLIINFNMNSFYSFNKQFVCFNLFVPDPKKVKTFDLKKALDFFKTSIYEPNAENGRFNEDKFNRELSYLRDNYTDRNEDYHVKVYNEFLDIFDDIGYLKENMYYNMDQIDRVNSEKLYSLYKKEIINNNPIVIVYGDASENIISYFASFLNFDGSERVIEIIKDKYYKPFKKMKVVHEKSNNVQSFLYIGYKHKHMKKEYEDYLILLKNILGNGTNRLIHNVLRYNHKLIYNYEIDFYPRRGILDIELAILNDKKDKALESVDEIFKSLKDKEFLQKCINNTIKDFKASYDSMTDSRTFKLEKFMDQKFDLAKSYKKLIREFENIDIDNFITFLDGLKKDTIFFKEGEFGEKM